MTRFHQLTLIAFFIVTALTVTSICAASSFVYVKLDYTPTGETRWKCLVTGGSTLACSPVGPQSSYDFDCFHEYGTGESHFECFDISEAKSDWVCDQVLDGGTLDYWDCEVF